MFSELTSGSSVCNTKCNYKLDQKCEVVFYQDDEKNRYIATTMKLFFEEVLMTKNEYFGLVCSYIWYKSNKTINKKIVTLKACGKPKQS